MAAAGHAGEIGGAVDVVDDGHDLLEIDFAGWGEPHTAFGPLEQLDPQLVFEGADLLAKRRLGDVQALGGAPEMELLGDRHEISNMSQFDHARPPGECSPNGLMMRRTGKGRADNVGWRQPSRYSAKAGDLY